MQNASNLWKRVQLVRHARTGIRYPAQLSLVYVGMIKVRINLENNKSVASTLKRRKAEQLTHNTGTRNGSH